MRVLQFLKATGCHLMHVPAWDRRGSINEVRNVADREAVLESALNELYPLDMLLVVAERGTSTARLPSWTWRLKQPGVAVRADYGDTCADAPRQLTNCKELRSQNLSLRRYDHLVLGEQW